MAFYSYLRVTFLCLSGIFFLFTLLFELWQKKWNRLCLDIFVCLIQVPLWIILGIAILRFFPDLIYSYFPGIWMIFGLLLWITPHCIMTATAIRRKDRFDITCSIAGLLSIISFCVFIYFWDLTKNAFLSSSRQKIEKVASLYLFSWHFTVVSEWRSFYSSRKFFSAA